MAHTATRVARLAARIGCLAFVCASCADRAPANTPVYPSPESASPAERPGLCRHGDGSLREQLFQQDQARASQRDERRAKRQQPRSKPGRIDDATLADLRKAAEIYPNAVVLTFCAITREGKAQDCCILQGHAGLDVPVLKSLEQRTFEPGREGSASVDMNMVMPVKVVR